MINGNRKMKEFFNDVEINLLKDLKINGETKLENAYNILISHFEKKYKKDISNLAMYDNTDKKYSEILVKLSEILPVY